MTRKQSENHSVGNYEINNISYHAMIKYISYTMDMMDQLLVI